MYIYDSSTISTQLARRYPIDTLTTAIKEKKLQNALEEAKQPESIISSLFFAYLTSDLPTLFTNTSKILKKRISHYLEESGEYPFPDPQFKPGVDDDIDIDNLDRYVDYEKSSPELLTPHVAIFFIQQKNDDFVHSALQKGGVNPNHTVGETSLLRVAASLLKVNFVRTLLELKADPNVTSPLEVIAKPMELYLHTQQITIAKELLCRGASPLSRFEGSSPKEGGYSLAELAEGKDGKNVNVENVNKPLIALLKKKELLQSAFEGNYRTLIVARFLDDKSCLYQTEVTLIDMIAQFLLQIICSDND